jgi:chromosomal replication initiator protein
MTSLETALAGPVAPSAMALAAVARRFGVTFAELTSKDRHRRLADARHVAAWVLRQYGLSYPEIGRVLCRDHTTAMHSVRLIEGQRATIPAVAAGLDGLMEGM